MSGDDRSIPDHWRFNSWEEKAQENPLFAVQTLAEMKDAPSAGFPVELLGKLFARGEIVVNTHLQPLLEPYENPFVIEYGCGVGRVLKVLTERGYRCGGIDISPTMLRHCQALVPAVERLSALSPLGKSNFDDRCAEFVFSYAVIQHISALSAYIAAIEEMARLVKVKGTLAIHLNCEDFSEGLDAPGRTENSELSSIHYRAGQSEPYRIHRQSEWSGVWIGHDLLTKLIVDQGLEPPRWVPHKKKPRAVWAISRRSSD